MKQIYNNPRGIRRAIADTLQIPIEEVEIAYVGNGFTISRPANANPDPEEVAAWTPPVVEPDPVDPLEAEKANLANYKVLAAQAINDLQAQAGGLLMMGGMSRSEAMAAGSAFVVQHSPAIQAFILAGGNPVAGQTLLDAILADPPAWWSEPMAALFADILTP